MKMASRGWIEWRRYLPFDRHIRSLARLDPANFGEQRLRVWMFRRIEQLPRRRSLDDATEVHDDDAVRQEANDAKIVTDEKIREIERGLELHEEVQNLRLDRYVERRDGFVANEKLGPYRECSRDADPRALTARELMRIAAHQRGVEPDAIQHRAYVLAALSRRDQPVRHRCFTDDVDDAHSRIQRRVRILKDHLQLQLLLARLRRGEVAKRRATPVTFASRQRQQSRGKAAECRFAAPRLADEADDFAGQHGEIDVVDGANDFLAHVRAKTISDLLGDVERLDEALRRAAKLDQRRWSFAGHTTALATEVDASG